VLNGAPKAGYFTRTSPAGDTELRPKLSITNTPLGRFRVVALLEGFSYVALLGVTMPLKYMADMPMPNKVAGMAHGVLSVVYVLFLLHAASAQKWSAIKSLIAFVASLVPLGAFALEWKLRDEVAADADPEG